MPSPVSARAFFRDPLGYAIPGPGDGPLLRMRAGAAPQVLVRDPDAVWQVLVTDGDRYGVGKWKRRARRVHGPTLNTLNGAEHRTRRLALQPAIGRPRVRELGGVLDARLGGAGADWEPGLPVALRDELFTLSIGATADVLLSVELGANARRLALDLAQLMAALPRLRPPALVAQHRAALQSVRSFADGLIAARREGAQGRPGDLLELLLGLGVADEVVRGEIIAFLLAAAEEPARALEAAWWLLARDEEADRRLAQELRCVLAGRAPTLADLDTLPWMRAVLDEALRLNPPARYIDRCPAGVMAVAGEQIPKGANLLISPLVSHRDARHFPEPEAFRPERMLGERRGTPRGAFIPFGAGVHACIGEPLARAIMGLQVAAIAGRWRLAIDPAAPEPTPRTPPLWVVPEPR
ncbi:unannotated protein [freshwater metagenome]|uniref:Unannotated protein n=1 Tax=freshwater metagenome TaxID=449393 RepID=A0A6J7E9N8_9ZZZZ|nr:cytochrome P450 [Actinomycetota bacterium]